MVRFVDIRVSTRLALAAAVFTVSKENTFRFLACMYINVVCRPHLSQEKIMCVVLVCPVAFDARGLIIWDLRSKRIRMKSRA